MVDIFTHGINAIGHGLIGYIAPFLFVLTIVVFFHELGHFLVARLTGVKVLTFSLGFGPELIGFNDRKGTRWKISAIPLGGYVKFFGDDNEASAPSAESLAAMSEDDRKVSFHHKNVFARAAIVAAGPIANFILAILMFAALFTFIGEPNASARVDEVTADSAASAAGFKPGDVVIAIDGEKIDNFGDMQRIVAMSAGENLTFVVKRGGSDVTLHATPTLTEMKDSFGNAHKIGVLGIKRGGGPAELANEKVDPLTGLWHGAKRSWMIVATTMKFLGGVFAGHGGADQVGGPLRIAQLSGQAASLGIDYLINLAAVLSVSIGLLNLFPVPLLDGGHLLFYSVEVVRGRPLSERAQEMGFRIGLALVLMLMIFATYNDILHLTAS